MSMGNFVARNRKDLIDVALGNSPADIVIKNVQLVNVLSREIHSADILLKSDRIAAVLPANEGGVGLQKTIDGKGLFAAPGFIDPHVHIESSMITVREYARMVIPRGTTMIAADPHEIGNVLGIAGMRAIFDEAEKTPLRVKFRVPGRIPAMPEWLETSNAQVSVSETRELFNWPEAVCLAGDINPNLVLQKDQQQLEKFDMADAIGKMISGQSPGLRGRALAAFIAAGPEDSHVAGSIDEIIENTRLGMASILALRPGRRLDHTSFADLARLVREQGMDTRQFQFCTDDIHAHDLLHEGHLDHRLRTAIKGGFKPAEAYQFCTINVAHGLRIAGDYGSISPGKIADILLLTDLEEVSVETTIIGGEIVQTGGEYLGPREKVSYPDWAKSTIRYKAELTAENMHVRPIGNGKTAQVRVITNMPGKGKKVRQEVLQVHDGVVWPDAERRINSFAMVERHKSSGEIGLGFADVVALKRGAIACSVNHDAHNIAIFGANYDDMAVAGNRIAEIGGGYVLACDGRVVAELALPIAGLMSEESAETVALQMKALENSLVNDLGGDGRDKTLIAMNFLGLPNIPKYGFTNKGLVASDDRMELIDSVIE
jgi:adenine deaminase